MTRTLTLRGVSEATLERLRARAAANRRSLNGELLEILDLAAAADVSDQSREAAPANPAAPRVREAAPTYAEATSPAAVMAATGPDLIEQVDAAAVAAVCRRHDIEWLAVFGSHACGAAQPHSDVDVVVDFAAGMTPGFGIVAVADALRPVFGGRRVDLVTRRGLAPRLRARVLASARTLYGVDARDADGQHGASGAVEPPRESGGATDA